MKKIFFSFIIALIFTGFSYAQKEDVASFVKNQVEMSASQTNLNYLDVQPVVDKDLFIKVLNNKLGQAGQAGGRYVWKDKNIDGLGERLSIELLDGILTKNDNSSAFEISESGSSTVGANQLRWARISVINAYGEDMMSDQKGEVAVRKFLMELINNNM